MLRQACLRTTAFAELCSILNYEGINYFSLLLFINRCLALVFKHSLQECAGFLWHIVQRLQGYYTHFWVNYSNHGSEEKQHQNVIWSTWSSFFSRLGEMQRHKQRAVGGLGSDHTWLPLSCRSWQRNWEVSLRPAPDGLSLWKWELKGQHVIGE